jgi:hypothetical protein
VSFRLLAARHGVSFQAIHRRAEREGWADGADVRDTIRRLAEAKASGVDADGDTTLNEKRAAAIDAAADRAASVIRRHQEEVSAVRERLNAGLVAHREATTLDDKRLAFESLKAAKISSETLLNIHKAERQAWGLETETQTSIVIQNPRRWDG